MRVTSRVSTATATLVAATSMLPSNCLSPSRQQTRPLRGDVGILPSTPIITRRLAAVGLLSPFVAVLRPAATFAFDNGVPDMELYRNKDKNPATQPTLGLKGNGKLTSCEDGLNCFSTTGDESHELQLWKPSKASSSSKANAMGEILDTIQAYPPGQARVDKGGFSIITSSADYLYVQFESMKHGFIDDVEFAVTDGKGVQIQVRSSSRLGELDLGVNAKRLNWISAELRAKGWTAPAIAREDYPDYFSTLIFTYDDYIRSVLSPHDCPVPAQPLTSPANHNSITALRKLAEIFTARTPTPLMGGTSLSNAAVTAFSTDATTSENNGPTPNTPVLGVFLISVITLYPSI